MCPADGASCFSSLTFHLASRMSELITIGKIEKPFGVKGEVRVQSLSDVPGRFEGLTRVTLVTVSGQCVDVTVRSVRKIKDGYLLSFEGVNTPEEAVQFRGSVIKSPKELAPALPPGQYYEFQLIGLIVSNEAGLVLGTLEEILETPGNHVFVIRGTSGEHLLPAIKEVVRSVDLDAGSMTVRWAADMRETADAV